jgi:hypothetical protein
MQKDYRDVLEVVKFDLIEETVGSWLRAIIQRLEKEQTAIRRDQRERPILGRQTFRGTPLYQKRHPKCARPTSPKPASSRRTNSDM